MSEIFEQGRFRRSAELLSLWLSGENDALIDRLSGEPRGASDLLDFLDQQGLRSQFIASLEGSPSSGFAAGERGRGGSAQQVGS